jgi:hypothetical protein
MSYPIEECHGGEIFEYRPQRDDPEFMVAVGPCPLWPGCGCEWDLPEIRDGEPEIPSPPPDKPILLTASAALCDVVAALQDVDDEGFDRGRGRSHCSNAHRAAGAVGPPDQRHLQSRRRR